MKNLFSLKFFSSFIQIQNLFLKSFRIISKNNIISLLNIIKFEEYKNISSKSSMIYIKKLIILFLNIIKKFNIQILEI